MCKCFDGVPRCCWRFPWRPCRQPAAAQTQSVTSTDIQRLQDPIADVSRDVTNVRSRDPAARLAARVRARRSPRRGRFTSSVKVRKNESVSRSEYTDLQAIAIEDVRSRARGDSDTRSSPGSASDPSGPNRRRSRQRRSTGQPPIEWLRLRSAGRHRIRCTASERAQFGDRASRRSFRGDDDGRSARGRRAWWCRPDR